MSWNVSLEQDGRVCRLRKAHSEGGMHVLGGTMDAMLNVTYNYGPFFYEALDAEKGLWWLDGKTAGQSMGRLEAAVDKLGASRDSDYWKATPGNAGYALSVLLGWARQHSCVKWYVR